MTEDNLSEIIEILRKVLPKILENPSIISGCDVYEDEINEIEDNQIISLEVMEYLAGDEFFSIYNEDVGINEEEAEEITKFLFHSARNFFEELKEEFPYIEK